MANLYEASYQWSNRPDDERYSDLESMRAACRAYADSAQTGKSLLRDLRVEANSTDNNLHLVGSTGKYAKLTHYSFGQLARLASAPPEYLRRIPATLAAQNLNHGLKKAGEGDNKLSLLFHTNGSLVARAITTDSYDRVWNYEVIQRLQSRLEGTGWRVPPARPVPGQKGTRKATQADILPNQGDFGLSVKVGDDIAPAGLYASDHDMFSFLVNQSDPISDGTKLLHRGVFVRNSEVGDGSLWFKLFTYDNVCGNHIVWGVGQVVEVRLRHIKGENVARGKTLSNAMAKWQVISSQMPNQKQMEATIAKARTHELGATKEDVLDALFSFARTKALPLLTKSTLENAYKIAESTPRYGNPNTVWSMVNGLTEYSQIGALHSDTRTELDVQAGKLMEIAF